MCNELVHEYYGTGSNRSIDYIELFEGQSTKDQYKQLELQLESQKKRARVRVLKLEDGRAKMCTKGVKDCRDWLIFF